MSEIERNYNSYYVIQVNQDKFRSILFLYLIIYAGNLYDA